jgi:carbonic anhydrase
MKSISIVMFSSYIILLLVAGFAFNPKHTDVALSPLEILIKGNNRFSQMQPVHPHESKKRVQEISSAQHPIAAVVCCSDSRVPPELIFDQGLGDLFVVRTAGNLIGGLEIGSIEYAVEHLGVKLIVVMGHKQCGAIKAFAAGGEVPGHIKDIVDSIKAESEIRCIAKDEKDHFDDFIKGNILHGINQLQNQSVIIKEKIKTGELTIIGSCYDLEKGVAELIK